MIGVENHCLQSLIQIDKGNNHQRMLKSLGETLMSFAMKGQVDAILNPLINLSSTKFGTSRHYVPPDVVQQEHCTTCDVFLSKEKFGLNLIKCLDLKANYK